MVRLGLGVADRLQLAKFCAALRVPEVLTEPQRSNIEALKLWERCIGRDASGEISDLEFWCCCLVVVGFLILKVVLACKGGGCREA